MILYLFYAHIIYSQSTCKPARKWTLSWLGGHCGDGWWQWWRDGPTNGECFWQQLFDSARRVEWRFYHRNRYRPWTAGSPTINRATYVRASLLPHVSYRPVDQQGTTPTRRAHQILRVSFSTSIYLSISLLYIYSPFSTISQYTYAVCTWSQYIYIYTCICCCYNGPDLCSSATRSSSR